MYPVLFHVGGFTMNSFGVMMALAFISGGFVAHWQFKKRGIRPDFIYSLLIAAVIGGLLGAKIHYLILHPSEWPGNLLSGGGLVWFGGLFGAIIGVVIVTKLSKERLAAVMDAGAIAVSIGYAVGRMGCFLRGDDYGVPTDLPWGMCLPRRPPAHDGQGASHAALRDRRFAGDIRPAASGCSRPASSARAHSSLCTRCWPGSRGFSWSSSA